MGQEFPIAVGSDTTFSFRAVYGGLNSIVPILGDSSNPRSINAQLVDASGALLGSRISLGATGPFPGAIPLFDGTNYFLVWREFNGNLKGQFINTSGSLIGSSITIATNFSTTEGPVGFAAVYGEASFLVVFTDNNYVLKGQFVDRSGKLVGNQITISSNQQARDVSLAYDGTNFLACWVRIIPSKDKDIYGQFVSKTGSLVGNNFLIDGGANYSDNPTSLAFDGTRYLLAFHEQIPKVDTVDSPWFLYGRFIDKTGIVQNTFMICDSIYHPDIPMVSFGNNKYLITWTQLTNNSLMGQFYDTTGNKSGSAFEIFDSLNNKIPYGSSIYANNNFLVIATRLDSNFDNGDVYGKFITSTTGLPDAILHNKVFLYPNPASDYITVHLDGIIMNETTLNIYNLLGALVKTELLQQNQKQINVEYLDNGIYLVEIKSKEWTGKQKLIIQR